jgi:hypothetical protein
MRRIGLASHDCTARPRPKAGMRRAEGTQISHDMRIPYRDDRDDRHETRKRKRVPI